MKIFIVTVKHVMYGSRGPKEVEPVCGAFDNIESAREAIEYLVKTYSSEVATESFSIDEVEIGKIYFEY